MKIGFMRNVQEIELFGKTYKIASLTINDLVALDLVQDEHTDVPKEHMNIHKMVLSICYALSINYEPEKYTWGKNPFKYFARAYKRARMKQELSYNNLKSKLTLKNILDLTKKIEELNSLNGVVEKKKKAKR